METAEDELVTRPVSKNTIAAAGAPKLLTSAPNSVFALGGGFAGFDSTAAEMPAPAKRGPRALAVPKDRALDTIRSCGDLDKLQFASALSLSNSQGQKMLMNLLAAGAIEGLKVKGQLTRYRVANAAGEASPPAQGFKGWLARKGGGAAPRSTSTKRTPVVQIAPASDPEPVVDNSFVCGLFNTGELMLEVDGKSMRLTKARTRALVAYLDQLAAALEPRSPA